MTPLSRRFYAEDTVAVARKLLGKLLVRVIDNRGLVGRIVETEAYRGRDDTASHASKGMTERNRVMFGPPGYAYVYFTYGMHFCFNAVAHPRGLPGAVLVRAVEPIHGIELMREWRGTSNLTQLCSGPAKLTRALGIDGGLNGHDLTVGKELFIATGKVESDESVGNSKRIGVTSANTQLWRFYLKGNAFVSNRRFSR